MSGVHFTANTVAVDRALNQLVDFGQNPYAFLDEVGGQLVSSTQDRFDTSTAPDGSAWKPSQRALKEGGKTLKKDGHLVGSITHEPSNHSVDVGTSLIYGAIHQLGGKAGRGGSVAIDQREYLGLSPEDEQMVIATGYEFIEAATR